MVRSLSLVLFVAFFTLAAAQKVVIVPEAISSYAQMWSMAGDSNRLALIHSFWKEESTYVDAAVSLKGVEALNNMVSKFRSDFPNATIESEPILMMDKSYTWNWKILLANGDQLVAGRDYAKLDEHGKIMELIGFWEKDNSAYRNQKIVAKYFECLFKTRDFATMSGLIAPEATYFQATGLPYGGTFVGFTEWLSMFSKASSYYDLTIEKEPSYLMNDDHKYVIVSFSIKCISKANGKSISMPISEHFEVSGDKIISIRPFYFDTKTFSDFLK